MRKEEVVVKKDDCHKEECKYSFSKDSIVEMEIDTGEECECCFQKINSTVDKNIN